MLRQSRLLLCAVLVLVLCVAPHTAQPQPQPQPEPALAAEAPSVPATSQQLAAAVSPLASLVDLQPAATNATSEAPAAVAPAPSQSGTSSGTTARGGTLPRSSRRRRRSSCPRNCVATRQRGAPCRCVARTARSWMEQSCCSSTRCSTQKLAMRYTARGRITQEGRRAMEQGVYDYVRSLPGVRPETIRITSVLSSTRGTQAPAPGTASIIQLSEVNSNNRTVIIRSAAEEQPLSASELAAGASDLDREIAEQEQEDAADQASGEIGAQSSRRNRRGPLTVTMYVSFCGDRGDCNLLKEDWNRLGPCSAQAFGNLCESFYFAEGELGCVDKGTIFSSGSPGGFASCQWIEQNGRPIPPIEPSPAPPPSPRPSPRPSPSPRPPSPSPAPKPPSPSPNPPLPYNSPSPAPPSPSPGPVPSSPSPSPQSSPSPSPSPTPTSPSPSPRPSPSPSPSPTSPSPSPVPSPSPSPSPPNVTFCSNTTLPPLPANATSWSISCSNLTAGQTCTAQCATNYTGSPTATCGPNGTFLSPANGTCTRITVCSNTTLPPLPANATSWSSSCSNLTAGQTCTAQCATNYTGSPTATCGPNGTFLSPANGTCTRINVTCQGPLPPLPGNATWPSGCNGTFAGGNCTAQCDIGYNATGSLTSSCNSSGSWEPVTGGCSLAICGSVPVPSNTTWNCSATNTATSNSGRCEGTCNNGTSGNPVAQCLSNGTWLITGQPCVLRCTNISDLTTPANSSAWNSACDGAVVNSTCPGQCLPDYVGTPPEATCNSTGKWFVSGTGNCTAVVCNGTLPTPPLNGTWPAESCNGTLVGGNCTAQCDIGYNATGQPTSECNSTGLWEPVVGVCTVVNCSNPEPLLNADAWSCTNTTFGGACTAVCNATFTGTPTAVCGSNGSWEYAGNCSAIVCTNITGLTATNANWTDTACDGSVVNSTCNGTCFSGYVGTPPVANCSITGDWEVSDTGNCTAQCNGTLPTPPLNAAWPAESCNGTLAGDSCTAQCITGYNVTVQPTSLCNSTGGWEPPVGSGCTIISCDPLPTDLANTIWPTSPPCETTYGATCNATCADTFIDGPNVTCGANGEWEPQPTACSSGG